MSVHTILLKPVSSLCNMHCSYCFYLDEAANRKTASYGMMSEETLKQIIRKVLLQAADSVCFAFQGGEPTLRGLPFYQKAIELEQRFNKNHVPISNTLQTNGIALDENWCRFFKEHQFLVGISVDGTKESHDQYRRTLDGSPSFSKTMEAIRLLDSFSVDYNILTVVNSRTASDIREIYRFYRDNGWKYQQYITCLDPLFQPHGLKEYSLTPRAYGQFLITLFELWYKDWKRGKAPYIRQFENYVGILLGFLPEACEQSGICGIQCVTEADGSVYPCDFYVLDEYRLGSFCDNRITDLFQTETARRFVAESAKTSPVCISCPYYPLCRNGCRRNRIRETGSDTWRNYFCEGLRMFFQKHYCTLEEIAKFLRK